MGRIAFAANRQEKRSRIEKYGSRWYRNRVPKKDEGNERDLGWQKRRDRP